MKIITVCFFSCVFNLITHAQQISNNADDTTRQIKIQNGQMYLNFPVAESAKLKRARIIYEGKVIDKFTIKIDAEKPDYWVFFDVSPYQGKTLTVQISKSAPPTFGQGIAQPAANTEPDMNAASNALKTIFTDSKFPGQDSLYKEKNRP